ncbi:MAG: hypothetical protein H0W56_00200 [Acidothermales bacterium]|nr:hypothetical protein [Acidothermales bacterium]
MPRLTTHDYLFFHAYLHEVWHNQRKAFSLISTRDQSYLHQYFRPSETLTDPELLVHRNAITAEEPCLPQCAGRALRHLADPLPMKQSTSSDRIVLYPLLNPNPDLSRMARALLRQAMRQVGDEQRGTLSSEDSSSVMRN